MCLQQVIIIGSTTGRPARRGTRMKIRNDTDRDRLMFGWLHVAMGSTVEIPGRCSDAQREQLRREFTEVTDEPAAAAITGEPGYHGMTVAELREEIRGRGLAPGSRNKMGLVVLLEENDAAEKDRNADGTEEKAGGVQGTGEETDPADYVYED